ncbi:MAG: autotransporter domain-containing protein [Acetobacter sp.]|nr:autotransporter domain-containing protein [Acetobacter sp.]
MKIKKKILLLATLIITCTTGYIKPVSAQISVAQAFYTLARQNNTQKIERLLHKGYSLESVNEKGYNSVCLAVDKNDKRAYEVLISYGANKKPTCLKKIPESKFQRFFGYYPQTELSSSYVPDSPYLVGTAALAAGAITAAYLLRGDTGGGSGNSDDNQGGGDNPTPPTPPTPVEPENCPPNSSYSSLTGECVCNYGYDHYGDASGCYAKIANCATQNADKCSKCEGKYVLKNNVCHAPIPYCFRQDGDVCQICDSGYGVHNSDGKACYRDIENCEVQEKDSCTQCIAGFGTHGDSQHCYNDIAHCVKGQQVLTACRLCEDGYSTYGDPNANVCYSANECDRYNDPNAVPTTEGGEVKCICNANKGYEGEPGSCKQAESGDYQEGEGNRDEWNNLNELYCNSHGKYIDLGNGSWTCNCYPGYDNSSQTCDKCDTAQGYDHFGNDSACFRDMGCEKTFGKGFTQSGNQCICKEGYLSINGQCYEPANCTINQTQVKDASEPDACKCKPNFNEECTECISDKYEYDSETGSCKPKECPEKWEGYMCSTCPDQFKITQDEDGTQHCGLECADNRAPMEENDEMCSACAEDYRNSPLYGTCIMDGCSTGADGYVVEAGQCVCDESKGYAMSPAGECQKKGEDFIGLSNSNVNNGILNVDNDGEFRDVYGMKPFIEEGEGEDKVITYYDEVYNAHTTKGDQTAEINITNKKAGNIDIYGIYAPSKLYNAAVSNNQAQNASATGSITIVDTDSFANIYGMYGTEDANIYNAFAYNRSDGGLSTPADSNAVATIKITKDEKSIGDITGIIGSGFIYNAYANTDKGAGANVNAKAEINITNEGAGTIIGIQQNSENKKVNNAFAFMNSAVSDAVAEGNIKLQGNGSVYGIKSKSTVANSETQFNQSFNKIGNFSSKGTIDVLTTSDQGSAYGIYLDSAGSEKKEIYNAMGYNSVGTIKATNTKGGSAFGIYSLAATYEDKEATNEDGTPVIVYNNVYNAFRSSQKYGGDNVAAIGNIEVNSTGQSSNIHYLKGAYTAGNMFNAYANSGSDVKLESIGNITINDNSETMSVTVRGIESNGVTIANAYAMGQNKNTTTNVSGDITLNITGSKSGTTGEAAGIYTNADTSQNAQIYNAALIKDQSNVKGNITVQSPLSAYAMSKMYGIYAESTGENAQRKNVYNAYYENTDGISGGSVLGTINVKAENKSQANEAAYYGIYVNNGTAYNAYSTNQNADVVGNINVDIWGSNRDSIAVGMYGKDATIDNSGKSTIDVKTSGRGAVAYGMKGDNSIIHNDARINVKSQASDAYGIYINNGAVTNDVNGSINVTGSGNNYGIYAISDINSSTVLNKGKIFVSGGNNTGIYASGANTTVTNSGTIILEDTENYCQGGNCNQGQYIVLNDGATFKNDGELSTTGSFDFDAMGDNVQLSKNGKFTAAESIKGNLKVASDVVENTFAKTSYVKDALSANNVEDVKLTSDSYLYNSETRKNENGKYDVVMKMKDFSDVYDSDIAQYYNRNYDSSKNMQLFNLLKSAKNKEEAVQTDAEVRGKAVLPNITMEELKVQRSLDRKMMSELFKDGSDIRKMVGADTLIGGRDNHGTLTGYDLNAQSMYALYDKKLDNHYRLGLGMSITHTDTDYNNDSTRKNFMVQGYVPLTYTNGKGLTAVSMARLGYADGEYKRRSLNHTYEADTNEITYGLLNELRYTVNLGGVNLTPFVGLNAIGWYQDSINEGNGALDVNIASSHVFSLESALGLYLDKEIEFNQDNKLNVALGIGYYHEFADPYRGFNARHGGDSLGRYKLRDLEHINSRNRGILSAKVNYDYKDFSIYGELLQYLEKEYPLDIDVGLKYKF